MKLCSMTFVRHDSMSLSFLPDIDVNDFPAGTGQIVAVITVTIEPLSAVGRNPNLQKVKFELVHVKLQMCDK